MCGIIGYIGFQDPKGILLDGLKRLEYRGYDSAGIAILENGKIELFRSEGRIRNLEERLGNKKFKSSVGIGHTRWATHGAPTEINAHPHRVGNITLIHNGIIENYLDHKEALVMMGREITSDTDSEIVAHLFDLEVKAGKNLEQAVLDILPRLKGSYAFVIMSDLEPDLLVGVRNGPPLLIGLGKDENFLASDVQAILHRTKKVVYLEDYQFALCRKNSAEIKNIEGKSQPLQIKTIEWTQDQMEKSGFRHYMLKEIHEQSQAVSQTIEGNIDHKRGIISLSELAPRLDFLKRVQKVSIVACGTAKHAGLVGKYYIERFARIPVEVDFASEFRYRDPVLSDDTLLLLISQSGETADTLAALREGKTKGIKTFTICNVRESTLARESDAVLYTSAGPEIGVASTKAFTTQLTTLYMLAVQLGFLKNELTVEQVQELTRDLLRLPVLIEKTLQLESQIEAIATEYHSSSCFFFFGRGANYPIALEGALKLKEISYLHAEGYPAGELKHGPIALIDKPVVTLALAPHDKPYSFSDHWSERMEADLLYEKITSNVQEVKARRGKIITFGTDGDTQLAVQSNFFLGVLQATWAINPILMTIPVQFFAYYVALARGTDVDKPRNLAKSVTVE